MSSSLGRLVVNSSTVGWEMPDGASYPLWSQTIDGQEDGGTRALEPVLSSQEKPEHRFKVVFTEQDSLSASILWVDAVNAFGLPLDAIDAAEKVANLFDSRGVEIVSISYLGLTVQEDRSSQTTYRRAGGRTRAVYAA